MRIPRVAAALAQRALLVACGLGAGLAAAETLARLLLPGPGPGRFFRVDENTGWSHIPASEGWWLGQHPSEFKVWVRINSHGLRDRALEYDHPPGTTRILTLGDSMTAGFQVPLEQTFQKRLERELDATRPARKHEVINGGVNGYGTDNELLFYRSEGAKYHADVVCLMFYLGNDVLDNHPGFRSPFSIHDKPHYVLEGEELKLLDFPYRLPAAKRMLRAAQGPLARLALYRAFSLARVRWLARSRRADEHGAVRADAMTEWARGWSITCALLARIRREVEAGGAALLVVIVPPPEAVDPGYWAAVRGRVHRGRVLVEPERLEAMLSGFLEREGVRFFSLTGPLRSAFARTPRPLFYYADRHWNVEGHRVVAEAMARLLIGGDLLTEAPRRPSIR